MKIKAYSIDAFEAGIDDISVYEDIMCEFINGDSGIIIEFSDNVVDLYIENNKSNLNFLLDVMVENERYESAAKLKELLDE